MARNVNRVAECQKVFSKTDWFYKPGIRTQMKCFAMFKHKRMTLACVYLGVEWKYPVKFENKDFFTNVLIPLQNKLYLHLGGKKQQTVLPIFKWYTPNLFSWFRIRAWEEIKCWCMWTVDTKWLFPVAKKFRQITFTVEF